MPLFTVYIPPRHEARLKKMARLQDCSVEMVIEDVAMERAFEFSRHRISDPGRSVDAAAPGVEVEG